MSLHTRSFNKTKRMSFPKENYELLEKGNKIQDRVSNIIEKDFNNKPVEGEKYLIEIEILK